MYETDRKGNDRGLYNIDYQYVEYFPFGQMIWENDLAQNKVLFTGKEFQDGPVGDDVLRLYDFGARFYDPTVGRWTTIDPLAEMYYSQSPYNFCGNNPVMFVDRNGMNYTYAGGIYYKTNSDGTRIPVEWEEVLEWIQNTENSIGISPDSEYLTDSEMAALKSRVDIQLQGLKTQMRQFSEMVSYLGSGYSTIGGLKYTQGIFGTSFGGFWRGANGQFYSMSESLKGRGWALRANSMNLAKNSSFFKNLRISGNILGGLSTAYSGYQFFKNPNWIDGLDTGFGVAGLLYAPVGGLYGLGKFLYNGQMRHSQHMLEMGLQPGRDDLMWMWKP